MRNKNIDNTPRKRGLIYTHHSTGDILKFEDDGTSPGYPREFYGVVVEREGDVADKIHYRIGTRHYVTHTEDNGMPWRTQPYEE